MRPVLRPRRAIRAPAIAAAIALSATGAFGQEAVITGRVLGEQGQTLQAANVFITEMNISVPTNEQGAYRITLPSERVRGQTVMLRARAIGHTPQARQITLRPGETTENFSLKADVNRLSEIVVTGVTGETEKKKLAFAVTSVDAADLPVPASNALTSLQGKVPGAQITMPSGRPGTAPSIVLRGPKSINASGRSQAPLVIVDGIILNGGTQDINPQDVESVEIVKGAAASSLYGARAAAGVIQITTKSGRGSSEGVRFTVRSELGLNDVQSEYPYAQQHFLMMDETQTRFCIKQSGLPTCSRTVDFEEEARRINDVTGVSALAPYNFERDGGIGLALTKPELRGLFQVNPWPKRYNPMAATVTNNPYENTNIDVLGRFGGTGIFASASNLTHAGAIKFLDGYKRNSVRANLDQAVGDKWTMQLQSFYSRGTQYRDGEWFRLTRVPAGVNLMRRDSEGRLFIRSNPLNQGQQNENPLYDNENRQGRNDQDRFLGSFNTRYTPLSWLDFDANASFDRRRTSGFNLTDRGFRVTAISQSNAYLGSLGQTNTGDQSYNVSLSATARQQDAFGLSDLGMRYNVRYGFDQQDAESNGSGNNPIGGNTLAVPGLNSLDNVTVLTSPTSSRLSIRGMAVVGGAAADYKGRYIVDGIYRMEGSSLFGADERWHPYYRGSLAWVASDEPWWPLQNAITLFKPRVSVGTAGGRPRFSAQYETFTIGTGGTVSGTTLGNRKLKPENTTETEYGLDAELFGRYGLTVTYARDITEDQILQVPPPASSGFSNQWKNAGQLDNKTWEVSLNAPIVNRRNFTWTARASYDRNRSIITGLDIPPYFQSDESSTFRFGNKERIGTVWGKYFIRDCSQLPSQFSGDCGPGKSYQRNDEGFIVWTGGFSPGDGIKQNLWQAVQPGCMKGGAPLAVTGEVACKALGGTVNNPWAIPATSWGMPIVIRDSTGNPVLQKLGNTQPDFRASLAQTFTFRKWSLYALLDGEFGRRVFNEEIHWSLGDFNVRYEDQGGKTVETAKPIGYYWRAPQPDNGSGVGGFYDVLGSNNVTVQKATFAKLRELSLGYAFGPIRGVGDWSVTVVGRNLYTFTDFLGWDPEVGTGGTDLNSGAIGGVAAYQYPQIRTFTATISTRF
jgi:TonB-linked SusC/RagA family outer membrane protein